LIKLSLQAQTLQKLTQLVNPQNGSSFDFLGFKLNLESGIISDKLNSNSMRDTSERYVQIFVALLCHYALANPTPLSGKLVKFKDLPGGYAYEGAFVQRAIQPIAEVFGEKPEELPKAARLLGGLRLNLGDSSVEINALKDIPLTYILWKKDEFPASATILYDESASNYLPTEDLAVLGELTTARLISAKQSLNVK
jgi:hypothetical protein